MKIAGVGCCLVDYVYSDFRYEHPLFQELLSKKPGDGGIIPGGLVFSEDLEAFAGKPFDELLRQLVEGKLPDISNLGGPSVVALVHAAQMLYYTDADVVFYGGIGKDERAEQIRSFLDKTPIQYEFKTFPHLSSPSTLVFSDPTEHGGKGERSFINTIGAAGAYTVDDIPESCYDADILLCGGTALVPQIHEGLGTILRRAKQKGCITVVGTVYDFKNEKRNPGKPWPLGDADSYQYIDLLITDAEEALKLTGAETLEEAGRLFIKFGASSAIITHGAKEVLVCSQGGLFQPISLTKMPVSKYVDDLLDEYPEKRRDSTGCGDNFVGGAVTYIALELKKGNKESLDIQKACAWGAASGGFTCMYDGGTYYELEPGEKRKAVEPILSAYYQQTGLEKEN